LVIRKHKTRKAEELEDEAKLNMVRKTIDLGGKVALKPATSVEEESDELSPMYISVLSYQAPKADIASSSFSSSSSSSSVSSSSPSLPSPMVSSSSSSLGVCRFTIKVREDRAFVEKKVAVYEEEDDDEEEEEEEEDDDDEEEDDEQPMYVIRPKGQVERSPPPAESHPPLKKLQCPKCLLYFDEVKVLI
jgi:hypothetical protein